MHKRRQQPELPSTARDASPMSYDGAVLTPM
jgi:hypothetical protein